MRARSEAQWVAQGEQVDVPALWLQILCGTWSIVELYDQDGLRSVIVRRNPRASLGWKDVTTAGKQVVARAAEGKSHKVIADELRISTSAVAGHLARAARTVGARSRLELVAAFREQRGAGAMTDPVALFAHVEALLSKDGDLAIVSFPLPAGVPPLTAAERAIVALLLAGESNRVIARTRGTAIRTVANQVASIFQKLGVGSRLELVTGARQLVGKRR